LVVYDVPDDRVRHQISEACLDFGLERFQMSAFWGHLTASRRKELFSRLVELLGDKPSRILVQPVGAEDLERRYVLHQKGAVPPEGEGEKKHRQYPEPGYEKPTIVRIR
jgi:CRISPR-associated protein Cas2